MQRVDAEPEAMGQQGQSTALVEDTQLIPECRIIAKRQISFPFRMSRIDPLGHRAVLEIARRRRHVDPTHEGLEAAARCPGDAESFTDEFEEQKRQRDIRRATNRFTQRQRLQRTVIFILRQITADWLATRQDDCSNMSSTGMAIGDIKIIPLPRLRWIDTVLDRGLLKGPSYGRT
jgi:hypothetical protein